MAQKRRWTDGDDSVDVRGDDQTKKRRIDGQGNIPQLLGRRIQPRSNTPTPFEFGDILPALDKCAST
jgi:hypothetical protein